MPLTGNPEIDCSDAEYIVGSDECGYGAWAGPLVVCAAIVSREWPLASEVTDSKKLNHKRRVALSKKILTGALCNVITVPSKEIDAKGVYPCLLEAHARAIQKVIDRHRALGCKGRELVIVDGNLPILGAISLPKADLLVPAVSAASIVGKVYRDLHMEKLALEYPQYGFESSRGYGTKQHQEALEKYGPCPIHRRSYQPIASLIEAAQDQNPSESPNLDDFLAHLGQE